MSMEFLSTTLWRHKANFIPLNTTNLESASAATEFRSSGSCWSSRSRRRGRPPCRTGSWVKDKNIVSKLKFYRTWIASIKNLLLAKSSQRFGVILRVYFIFGVQPVRGHTKITWHFLGDFFDPPRLFSKITILRLLGFKLWNKSERKASFKA